MRVTTTLCVLLVVLLGAQPVNGQTICGSPPLRPLALQRIPFQTRLTLPAQPAVTSRQGNKERVQALLRVPPYYFAIIDSVAIKGTHPSDAYMALELRTTALNEQLRPDWARHFLYARDPRPAQDRAVHIREPLKIYAASQSAVELGVQTSSAAPVEAFAVTVTGEFVDCKLWGMSN